METPQSSTTYIIHIVTQTTMNNLSDTDDEVENTSVVNHGVLNRAHDNHGELSRAHDSDSSDDDDGLRRRRRRAARGALILESMGRGDRGYLNLNFGRSEPMETLGTPHLNESRRQLPVVLPVIVTPRVVDTTYLIMPRSIQTVTTQVMQFSFSFRTANAPIFHMAVAEAGLIDFNVDYTYDPLIRSAGDHYDHIDAVEAFHSFENIYQARVTTWKNSSVYRSLKHQHPGLSDQYLYRLYCDVIVAESMQQDVTVVRMRSHLCRRTYSVSTQYWVRWRDAHRALFESQIISVVTIRIPFYPPERDRLVDSVEELSLMLNENGQSMIYRHSMRHTVFAGYVYIRPVHLWSGVGITCTCNLPTCECCIEIRDRAMNAYNGIYDFLPSQYTADYDSMEPQVLNPFAWTVSFREAIANAEAVLGVAAFNAVGNIVDDDMPVLIPAPFGAPVDNRPVRGVHVITNVNESCAICMCDITDGTAIACGHNYHTECLVRWTENSQTCPMCRARVNMLVAESYEPLFVEYACTNELEGIGMYDDPVEYTQLRPRQGRFHLYIVKTNFGPDQRLMVTGKILQILDISDDDNEVEISGACTNITVEGRTEYFYSSAIPLEFKILHTPVVSQYRPKVLFVIVGTYGDIAPMRALSEAYGDIGGESKVLAPDDTTDFAEKWKEMDVNFRETCGDGYLHFSSYRELSNLGTLKTLMQQRVEEYNPDVIVTSFFVPCIQYIATLLHKQLVYYGSVPNNEGALVFQSQDTRWGQFWARASESFQQSMTQLAPLMYALNDGFSRFTPPVGSVLAVAPELHDAGVGTLQLPGQGMTVEEEFDIFHCFGSTASSAEGERWWIQQYAVTSNLKVLFQTIHQHPYVSNIRYIGKNDHSKTMTGCRLVVCHGGSGTLQTALGCGCAVLVEPTWVDQKYWISQSKRKGFLVEAVDRDSFIVQICSIVHNPQIWKKRTTGITPKDMIRHVVSKFQEPEDIDTFLWYSNSDYGCPSKVVHTLFGSNCLDHVGVGKRFSDHVELYDFVKQPTWKLRRKWAATIPSYVTMITYTPFVIKEEGLLKVLKTPGNCREKMTQYFVDIDMNLDKLHSLAYGKATYKFPSTISYNLYTIQEDMDADIQLVDEPISLSMVCDEVDINNKTWMECMLEKAERHSLCLRIIHKGLTYLFGVKYRVARSYTTSDLLVYQEVIITFTTVSHEVREGVMMPVEDRALVDSWWKLIEDREQLGVGERMVGGVTDAVFYYKQVNKVLKISVDIVNVNVEKRWQLPLGDTVYNIYLMRYIHDDGSKVQLPNLVDMHRGNVRSHDGVIDLIDTNTKGIQPRNRYATTVIGHDDFYDWSRVYVFYSSIIIRPEKIDYKGEVEYIKSSAVRWRWDHYEEMREVVQPLYCTFCLREVFIVCEQCNAAVCEHHVEHLHDNRIPVLKLGVIWQR